MSQKKRVDKRNAWTRLKGTPTVKDAIKKAGFDPDKITKTVAFQNKDIREAFSEAFIEMHKSPKVNNPNSEYDTPKTVVSKKSVKKRVQSASAKLKYFEKMAPMSDKLKKFIKGADNEDGAHRVKRDLNSDFSPAQQKMAQDMKMDDPNKVLGAFGTGKTEEHKYKQYTDTDDEETTSKTTKEKEQSATLGSGTSASGANTGLLNPLVTEEKEREEKTKDKDEQTTPVRPKTDTTNGAGNATSTPSGDADNNPCNSGDIQKNSEFNQAEGEAAPAGSGQIGAGTRNGAVPVQQQTVKAVPPFTMGATPNDSGDKIMDVPDRHTEQGNLRQEYGMEKAQKVIPTVKDQMASDIRFDMFDTVNPGFGEGQDNKLFVMEQNRDAKIVYAKPMFQPGSYIGPIAGVDVPPWQLQRVMPKEKVQRYGEEKKNSLNTMVNVVMTNGAKSTNLLGDDVGYPYDHSACELKRKRLSPLEPVIRTDMNWEHVKDPIGVQLNKHKFRRYTDSQRYPRHLETQTAGIGGQHLSKRRGLEVILQ